MKKINSILILFLVLSFHLKAQDLIIKTTGDTIKAKITEVGTNAISYKKWNNQNGPTFVESKSDIQFVKYSNGEVQQFTKANIAGVGTSTNSANTNTSSATSNTTATAQQPDDGKNKIERDGKKYLINGKKAKSKEVDKLLGKSKNPAILVPLKVAKMTKTAQKIVKFTSIPTSIGGGFATLVSVIDLYNDVRRGRDNSKTYVNFGMSLVGTLTLPITNKILKKKSDGMYDKLIDMYNVTN